MGRRIYNQPYSTAVYNPHVCHLNFVDLFMSITRYLNDVLKADPVENAVLPVPTYEHKQTDENQEWVHPVTCKYSCEFRLFVGLRWLRMGRHVRVDRYTYFYILTFRLPLGRLHK